MTVFERETPLFSKVAGLNESRHFEASSGGFESDPSLGPRVTELTQSRHSGGRFGALPARHLQSAAALTPRYKFGRVIRSD